MAALTCEGRLTAMGMLLGLALAACSSGERAPPPERREPSSGTADAASAGSSSGGDMDIDLDGGSAAPFDAACENCGKEL